MKMTKKATIVACGIILTGVLTGCMDTVNTTENTEKSMQRNFVKNKRVVTDGYLDRRLEVLRVDSETLPNGLLRVQVTLKSTRTGFWDWLIKGDSPYKISYRFTWLNNAGMAINTASSVWTEKDVLPGDTVWISSVGPNSQCKDFVLKLRELE
jgi:hypothetical protein